MGTDPGRSAVCGRLPGTHREWSGYCTHEGGEWGWTVPPVHHRAPRMQGTFWVGGQGKGGPRVQLVPVGPWGTQETPCEGEIKGKPVAESVPTSGDRRTESR